MYFWRKGCEACVKWGKEQKKETPTCLTTRSGDLGSHVGVEVT